MSILYAVDNYEEYKDRSNCKLKEKITEKSAWIG